ncbi:MAG TPA: OmpA family protein [Stellaceae bacterium]|nr:OmpA family protein [Stellaceae bacterium]
MTSKFPTIAAASAIAILLAGAAGAQQVKSLGANPSSDQLIQALTPQPGTPPLKFRGIRLLTAKPAAEAEARAPAVALDIKFGLNSAELTPEAKEVVKQLATAMKSEQLASYHFLLEGHTDSTGKRQHNIELSKRRAESVRNDLVQNYGIPRSRLEIAGKGPDEPLDKADPANPANRRVQIVNLGQ